MVEARLVVTALVFVLAMFLAGIHGLRHRIGIAILALLSVAWFTVDKLFEGDVLFQIDRNQGLTTSDFVGLLGLVVAAALWWRSRPGPSQSRVTTPAAPGQQDTPEPTRVCSWSG